MTHPLMKTIFFCQLSSYFQLHNYNWEQQRQKPRNPKDIVKCSQSSAEIILSILNVRCSIFLGRRRMGFVWWIMLWNQFPLPLISSGNTEMYTGNLLPNHLWNWLNLVRPVCRYRSHTKHHTYQTHKKLILIDTRTYFLYHSLNFSWILHLLCQLVWF